MLIEIVLWQGNARIRLWNQPSTKRLQVIQTSYAAWRSYSADYSEFIYISLKVALYFAD